MFDLIKYGSSPCLEGGGRAYSYREVHAAVGQMRPALTGRQLVLCLCENSVTALLGYIGLLTHDQVVLLVEASQRVPALLGIIEQYDPDLLWLPESLLAELGGGEVVHRVGHYVMVRRPGRGGAMDARLQVLLTTSGSTGSSKFVRLTRTNLAANAASITAYLGIHADDVAITTLPFSYSFGLSVINTHLLAGASIQVTELTPLNREFWDLAREKRVTSLSGVPYTFEMLRRIKFERFELDAIRYLAQAGGKPSPELSAWLAKVAGDKGWSCFFMYGQTEASARMAYLPPAWVQRKLGSIGHAIPGGRFELLGHGQQPVVQPGDKGELVYYGPNVGMGYATGRADLARGDDWNGRLATGDLAYRDADGCYFISGRLKRFIKVFGNRVSLDEAETLLHAEYRACEFVCSGQDDCLRIGYCGTLDEAGLVKFAARQLSIHRTAIQCQALAEIPRLGNGKVNYAALAH